jgi:hypothetical protein
MSHPFIMWDPETSITCQERHIYANFRRFYVEREDLLARNWQALESEVYYMESSLDSGMIGIF